MDVIDESEQKSICATKPWSEFNDMDAHTVW